MKKGIQIFTTLLLTTLLVNCNSKSNNESSTENSTQDSINMAIKEANEIKFSSYCNETHQYCINYPDKLLIPQGQSDSGDGQVFLSSDKQNELRVYRDVRDIVMENDFSIQKAYNEDSAPEEGSNITYKMLGHDYYVISGYQENKIFYQKTIFSNDKLSTAILLYKISDREVYEPLIKSIFEPFK